MVRELFLASGVDRNANAAGMPIRCSLAMADSTPARSWMASICLSSFCSGVSPAASMVVESMQVP
jgi:hypothetical protein